MSRLRALRFVLPLILLGSCNGGDEPVTPALTGDSGASQQTGAAGVESSSLDGSVLVNGGFETGIPPWFTYDHIWWGRFGVSRTGPIVGRGTSMLELDHDGPIRQKERVSSLIQELRDVKHIPKTLRGKYYVERWEPGLADPWIEVALAVSGADIKPASSRVEIIAWPLAGRKNPIAVSGNRREIQSGPIEVETGRWIDFEIPVWESFREAFNLATDDCLLVRLYGTVRVKGYKKVTKGKFSTLVRFDDLYLGD